MGQHLPVHPLYQRKVTPHELRTGCFDATLAKACEYARTGLDDDIRWWDQGRYVIRNYSGDIGIMAILDRQIVALLHVVACDRDPYPYSQAECATRHLLVGAPDEVRQIARTELVPSLHYVDNNGDVMLGTCGFWSDGVALQTSDSWSDMFWYGLALLSTELSPPSERLETLTEAYSLNPEQQALLHQYSEYWQSDARVIPRLSAKQLSTILDFPISGTLPGMRDDEKQTRLARVRPYLEAIRLI